MGEKIKKAAGRLENKMIGLTDRVIKDEEKSRRVYSEAKLMAHFSVITLVATFINWIIYYILIFLEFHANFAFSVGYIVGVALIFVFKIMMARKNGEVDPIKNRSDSSSAWSTQRKRNERSEKVCSFASRLFKFTVVYLISLMVGNAIVYTAASFVHDGWALWFSYPFTFTINSLGNRFFVFKDADDRQTGRK